MVTSITPASAIAKSVPAPSATRGGSAVRMPFRPAPRTPSGLAAPAPAARPSGQSGATAQVTFPFFGPKRYTRTAGPPNVFNETIAVPPWLVGPYTLRVQNGEPDGTRRVSAASIVINGVTVATQSDFNQNVGGFDRAVTLTPSTTMQIRLESTPGGYLTINLSGSNADRTPPQVAVVAPVPGSSSANVSPRLVVSYRDLIGAGEPGASGANLSTLKVTLDDVDRTSLFTRGADQAGADLAGVVQLGEGLHTLAMAIQDAAGNASSTSAQFRVDLTAPSLGPIEPGAGEYVATRQPVVRVRYQDGAELDLQTLRIDINGTDRTSLFTKGTADATATLTEATQLIEGTNTISARVRDTAGNEATATSAFIVDVTKPVVAIAQPADGAYTSAQTVDVTGTITDSSAVRVTVNGVAAVVTGSMFTAADQPIGNGPNASFHVVATDAAGNTGERSVSIAVDRANPVVQIETPAAGKYFQSGSLVVTGTVADDSTTEVSVNGVPATVVGGTFTATLQTADGRLDLLVIARDQASNIGEATSFVVIDSVAPVLTIGAPVSGFITNAASVIVTGTASDSSPFGVTAGTSDVAVVNGAFSTTRPLGSEGEHTIELVATDAAGNVASQSVTVTIDRSLPAVQITTPVQGSFLATATPAVAVQWSDAKGVDAESLQVLIDGEDRTARFMKSSDGATGTPDALGEGPHRIVVRVRDRAGNVAEASASFTVDTTPPDVAIEEPTDGFFTASATVDVRGRVSDASAVRVSVNGVDAAIAGDAFTATGVPAGDAGLTTIRAVATDAAGNTRETSIRVNVDRAPPVVRITTPGAGAYLKGPSLTVTGTVTDVSPHTVDVNGQTAVVDGGTFTAQIPATDGALTIRATATDAAGNNAAAEVAVTIDTKAPDISVSSPATGTITNQNAIAIIGTVSDTAPVTVRVNDASVQLTNGAFSTTVPLAGDGAREIRIVAVDAAGNSSTHELTVTRDATPPTLTIVTPAENALVGQHPVDVTGLVQDLTPVVVRVNGVEATRAQSSWTGSAVFAAQGNQTITVTAVDAAGNQSTVVRTILLDTAAPTIVIDAPAADALTSANSVTVRGRVADVSLVSVMIGAVKAAVQAGEFSADVTLAEGENHLHVVATDALGRTGGAEVIVTRDSTPPSIEMAAPDTISRRRGAQASITASDSFALERVVVTANGAALGTFTQGQVAVDLTAPESLAVGAMLVVTATAVDRAGNTATATRSLRVIADGVIVGQAIADDTGLPLRDASVRVKDRTLTTDERGSYAIPASDISVLIAVVKDGLTTVERLVPVESGVGTAVVDARLTPLGAPVTLDGAAAALTSPAAARIANPVTISVPAGAAAAGTTMRLTQLSPQGLPGLLPLGWSPLAAFDLRSTAAPAALTATARLTTLVPSSQGAAGALPDAVHLVQYRPSLHAWVMVLSNLPVVDATATVDLPVLVAGLDAANAFAFVVPDAVEPPIPVAAAGASLTGVEMAALPPTATSAGAVTPAVLPPGGGTALGLLAIQSPLPLPSGTVVQTQVTETFTLATGEVASEETRNQDVVLYRVPAVAASAVSADPATFKAALSAHFPITPSRVFAPAQLVQGRVHLDVLAGREAVRGQTGGSEPLTLTSDGFTLTVPARALTEDTAIRIQPAILSTFLPSAADLQPLAEVMVDLSGATLTMGAELSLSTAALGAIGVSDRFLVARVERIDGVPRLAVVAVADNAGDRIVSRAVFGLSGITIGGRYVFYRTTTPFGFAVATVTGGGTPVGAALVSTDRWPFVARTNGAGNATVAAPEGSVRVSAAVPGTALEGSAGITLTADQMTLVPIALNGTVTSATVTPADGAGAVPPSIQIEVATTAPIAATSVETATVRLTTDGTDVAVRRVLAGSARTLAIVPHQRLLAATTYRLEVTGLLDIHGGPIAVAPVTFQTLAEAALVFNPENLRVSFPDANGVVAVTATAGSLPPGTNVLIVNAGSGEVVTFTVGNDGSLNGSLSATIDHRLIVTITDPKGQTATFHRTKYVAPDGTTAVGAAGGVIEGAGGVEVRIPEGAADNAVVMKIEPFGPDFMTERPAMAPGANFGSGIKIGSTSETHFKKEVDLAFPIPAGAPANPSDAFYYVYRRIQGPNGEVFFETLDNAFVEGTGANARVVTASFPFTGYKDGWNQWNSLGPGMAAMGFGQVGNMGTCHAILMWTHQALLPGRPIGGVIVGKILRPRFEPGAATPVYDGVPGVLVKREDSPAGGTPNNNIAITQANGQFVFYDNYFETGTVRIRAESGQETFYATAFAVAEADSKTVTDDALTALFARGHFQNIAYATITLPPLEPAPPAPQIAIKVFSETATGRRDIRGLAVEGTPLVIGFTAQNGTVRGATINGTEYGVRVDPLQGQTAAGGMDVILDSVFTPIHPGSYTVTASAVAPFGPPVQSSMTFRVIAAGGGTNTSVPGRPGVLSVAPAANDDGVATSTFIEIAFTEPVTGITAERVMLRGPDGIVPVRISGIALDPNGAPMPVDSIEPTHKVTSLTLMPLAGLRYRSVYQIMLTEAIVDRDLGADGAPDPQPLVPFTSSFTTFGPTTLGGSDETPRASGIVVLGERAYLAETMHPGGISGPNQTGRLRSYDVSNPDRPEEAAQPWHINYPPRDIAGEMDADGRRTIAVATSPRTWFFLQGELIYHYDIQSTPSNLFVFDVTDDAPRWIGAANISDNLMDGIPSRIVMKDGFVYAATQNKGIQVIDIDAAKTGFPETGAPENDYQRNQAIYKGGYNTHAVVANVPVMEPADANPGDLNAYHLPLTDLKVEDYVVGGQSKRLVVATGPRKQIALVVVDPVYAQTIWRGPLTHPTGSVDWGSAIAVGTVAERQLVLVGGFGSVGTSSGVLAIVDMSPLAADGGAAPEVLTVLSVPHAVGDIIIRGTTAIVAGWAGSSGPDGPGVATLIDLTQPATPRVVGTLSGVGSRLALSDSGVLFSTERSLFKGLDTPLGGVRTAALDTMTVINSAPPVVVDVDGLSIEPQPIKFRAIFPRDQVETAEIEITDNGNLVKTIPVTLDAEGSGETALPENTKHSPLKARLIVNREKAASQRPAFVAERFLRAHSFKIDPAGSATFDIATDDDPLLLTAVNPALQKRLAEGRRRGEAVTFPELSWVVTGPAGPALGTERQSLSSTGFYSTSLLPAGQAGSVNRVELRVGSRVLGRSAPLRTMPGAACTALAENNSMDVPADGATKRSVRVYDVKDCFGNAVPDGRPVVWQVLPPAPVTIGAPGSTGSAPMPGALKYSTTYIKNGESTNEYTAGIEPGSVAFVAVVDDHEKPFVFRQRRVTLGLSMARLAGLDEPNRFFTLTAISDAGVVANGTPAGWGLTAGTLVAQPAVFDGTSTAQFTWPFSPRRKTVGIPYVFATVGRERIHKDVGIIGAERPSPGLFLRMLGQMLLGDKTQGERFDVPDGKGGVALSVPSQLSVLIGGGAPGQQVPLTIDSMRLPAYLAARHYTFDYLMDVAGDMAADDLFGGTPAQVGAGVEVDLADPAEGNGSLRFSAGGSGVTVPAAAAFAPTGSFGISTYVRLDSASAQPIVSRAGAYEMRTVLVNGEPRVEFSVMNGGVRRTVVSSDALPVGEWRHVSARLDSGHLLIHLGEAGIVNSGEAAAPPDLSTAPVVIGRGFSGHLDEVAFFDFTNQPYVRFSDGGLRTTVALDTNGQATVQIDSTGRFQGISAAALQRYGQNFIRIEVAPRTAEDWFMHWLNLQEALEQEFRIYVGPVLAECAAGLADGESGGNVGMACDLMLNLVSVVSGPVGVAVDVSLTARDAVVGARNFIEGKESFGNIVSASMGAMGTIATSKGPAGRSARLAKAAHKLLNAAPVVNRFVMREALVSIARGLGGEAATFPKLLEALGDETGRISRSTQDALVDLLAKSDDIVETAVALERLAGAADYEKLIATITGALGEISRNPVLRDTVASGLGARIVARLDEIAGTAAVSDAVIKLSPDAMYGMSVFLARGMKGGWKTTRLSRTWSDLGQLNRQKQLQAFDDMMKWIAEGERVNLASIERGGIKGWNAFLAGGPGRGGFGPQSTQGASFVLEYLSRKMKWQNIAELERGLGKCSPLRWRPSVTRCERYVDIVASATDSRGGELLKELKNLSAGATYRSTAQVRFDIDNVLKESLAANNGEFVRDDLIKRLSRLEYVLRGSEAQMKTAMTSLRRQIAEHLGPDGFSELADYVRIEPLGWDLPI